MEKKFSGICKKKTKPTKRKWPKIFFEFSPIEDVPDFKALRRELLDNLQQDPLA